MHDSFKTKDLSYQLRDNHTVFQTTFKGSIYGKHTFAYYGSCIWMPCQVKICTDIISFKRFHKHGKDPSANAICVMF